MANSPPLVIANCIQVKLGTSVAGQGAYNILHFQKAGSQTIDQADAEAIGNASHTAWLANMAPQCATNVAMGHSSVRDLTAPNQPEFIDTVPAVTGSSATPETLPAATALVVTIRTGLSGKSFRGRVYVTGFSEAANDANGLATGAAGDAALGFISDFADAMGALGFTLGVASRPANASTLVRRTGLPNGDIVEEVLSTTTQKAGGIAPFTSLQVRDLRWDTQRRRQNGRGGPVTFLADTRVARRRNG